MDGPHNLGNQLQEVKSTEFHIPAALCVISEVIFQNAASNMTAYVSGFPVTAQESDAMNMAKDFLSMFRASDSSWDSQKFLKKIIEI